MAFQRVPDTAEIDILYVQGTQPLQMTFHAEKVGGYNQADITSLAANADAEVGLTFKPLQTQDTTYLRTEVRGLDAENDLVATASAQAGAGAIGFSGLPTNVTLAVKKLSGLTGRSARGRVFWIGLAQSQLTADENFVDAAVVNTIVAAVDGMKDHISQALWQPVIVSRFTNGSKRVVGVTFNWIDTQTTDDRVDSQRNRLP